MCQVHEKDVEQMGCNHIQEPQERVTKRKFDRKHVYRQCGSEMYTYYYMTELKMKKICDDFSQFLIKGSNPWLISTASRSQFSPLHYRPLGVPCFVDDSQETQTHNAMQYNFIAKCQYTCTRNVLWCQVHSSDIHFNHKTLNCNSK